MRVFFALEIDNATKTEISRWRDIALPDPGRPVQSENFHITLDFLGEVTPAVLDQLVNAADHILRPDFDLTLDEAGYFAKAGVYWIAPSSVPRALNDLALDLRKISRRVGIKTDNRPYKPHLTLYRKCAPKPPLPTIPVYFEYHFRGFSLFESVTGPKGVRYDAIRRWE